MSSAALESQGTLLRRGDGGAPTEVFTAIGEITDLTGPSGSASVINVSDLNSVAVEKRMGLPDEGQFTLTLNFLPQDVQHAALRTDRASKLLRNFEFVFTDTTVWKFSAYVTGLSVSNSVDGTTNGNITLEISGPVVQV
jgi:hypothetical protein